jgi:hypothetical protein
MAHEEQPRNHNRREPPHDSEMDYVSRSDKPFVWRNHLKVHPAAELFPLLSPDELKTLADDIKAHGLAQRVVFDQNGALLDGRNRLDALALVGLLELTPDGHNVRVKGADAGIGWKLLDDPDPYDVVISLNAHRRHLTSEQKRELIAKVLKAKPEQSNRAIAKQVKTDGKTVASVRREMVSTAEIPQLEKTIGTDGRTRKSKPTKKPKEAVSERDFRERAKDLGCHLHVHRFSRGRKGYTLTNPNGNKEFVKDAEAVIQILDAVEASTTATTAVKTEPATPVNAKDIALESFDAHILELIRITKGQKPQRFAKTTVAQPLLGDLAHFLREVVAVRKLADGDA